MDLIAALRSFLRVSETRSFSAVATERGVTQPAVSRQVSALEEYLGTRLVQRSTHAVTLTEEGRQLVESAQQLIDAAEALQDAAGRRRAKPVGRVRLAVPVPLGLYLSSHLGPLLAEYDELSIDLVLRDGVSDLIEDRLDFEIRLGPIEESAVVARCIGRTTAFLVAAPDYLASRTAPADPHELARHDCIVYHRWGRDDVWWFSRSNDAGRGAAEMIAVTVPARIHANNAEAAYRAALDGRGIALLSHLLVAEDIENGRLRHLLPDFPSRRFPLHLVYSSRRSLPPRTRVVMEYLIELISHDPEMALERPSDLMGS